MDVVSLCPLQAAGFVWQSKSATPVQTVIVKATYLLRPGECPLAPDQDAVNEGDNHWNDDPTRSVHTPSDQAPFKPKADVLLVGHAFAPGQQPVRSLTARMVVGEVDKSIEVWCDRGFRLRDGLLLEGPRCSKMSLRWERAAGGPETINPVGMRFDAAPDKYGMVAFPNLQPQGLVVSKRSDVFAPLCFAPIAPSWPARAQRLGRLAGTFPSEGWESRPLAEDFDYDYFQAAPSDQQVTEIRANERIVIENLHPDHALLVTRLPGLRPRAVAERAEGEREEVELEGDTLWIDTDRGLCTVVWRGRIGLRYAQEPGRITVSMESDPGKVEAQGTASHARKLAVMTIDALPGAGASARAVMPFAGRSVGAEMEGVSSPAPRVNDGALPFNRAAMRATAVLPPNMAIGTMIPSILTKNEGEIPLFPAPPLPLPVMHSAKAVLAGARGASDAAALGAPSETSVEPAAPIAPASTRPSEYVDLLWFDEEAPRRIRAQRAWRELLRAPVTPGEWITANEAYEPKQKVEERRDVVRAMTRIAPADAEGVAQAMAEAIDEEGVFHRPLVVVSGDFHIFFDALETLKATIAVVSPLVGIDKKLKDIVDTAMEVAKSEWRRPNSAIEGMTARLREAFCPGKGVATAEYIDATVERMLLEQRRYQKRTILGAHRLRGAITRGAAAAMPVYVPEHLENNLPMFQRFKATLLAEAHGQQDQYESHPLALVVLALGRVLPLPPRSRDMNRRSGGAQ
jgi:hypothetical protein